MNPNHSIVATCPSQTATEAAVTEHQRSDFNMKGLSIVKQEDERPYQAVHRQLAPGCKDEPSYFHF